MLKPITLAALLVPCLALAQVEPRVVVVPVPSDAPDAGAPVVPVATPAIDTPPPPPPPYNPTQLDAPPPPPPPSLDTPVSPQLTPTAPPPGPAPVQLPPSAMVDGHPREGSFLSGPGSLAFITAHTILGTMGTIATQAVPRTIDAVRNGTFPETSTNEGARIAYLVGGLIGGGIGFGAASAWQFYNWIGTNTAGMTIAHAVWGSLFGAGFMQLISRDNALAISWVSLLFSEVGAWLTTIVGGGDLATNKSVLMLAGAGWSTILTGIIVAIIATTGGGNNVTAGVNALMLAPAIGAGLMALAGMKFNPSVTRLARVNGIGLGVGAAIFLISGLVLGPNFGVPTPYILGGVSAAAAMTLVGLLWAEGAEAPAGSSSAAWLEQGEAIRRERAKVSVWW